VLPSPSAAAARAAALVLAHVYPGAADFLNGELESQALARRATGESEKAREAGDVIGQMIALRALERARTDGADAIWDNVLPVGEGYFTGRQPAAPIWGGVRPWLVASGADMRAPAPPVFGSEAFAAALREVREISESRTPQQLAIALHWADGAGTVTPPGHWNVIAADLIRRRKVRESDALRTFALLNAAMADAMIGCWDTKYAYWYLRPWEADPAITTPIGRPNHPSYPSGHSCSSKAGAVVLEGLFPGEREDFSAMAEEASLSRLYGGIHYRFDLTAGQAIGRDCGTLALDLMGREKQFFAALGWSAGVS
jgi:membrane-associated phospholipid phosphatase